MLTIINVAYENLMQRSMLVESFRVEVAFDEWIDEIEALISSGPHAAQLRATLMGWYPSGLEQLYCLCTHELQGFILFL